jgi:hypothetical protein
VFQQGRQGTSQGQEDFELSWYLSFQQWQAFNGGNNGDGDGDSVRDMAACATTGERGIIVAMGYDFWFFLCEWRDHKK